MSAEGDGPGKRLLGVVASLRRGGNSEALVKVALQAAAERGALVDIIHLEDLRLGFCDGCLACVYKGDGCRKAPDITWLLRTAASYDGVVVASPTYFLGPPAQVKALIDHGVMEFPRLGTRRSRPAGAIAVAGRPGWDLLSLSVTSQLAMLLGGRLVGGFTAYAPGPAEVLLDRETVGRARELGLAVLEDRSLPVEDGVCPVCRLPRDAGPPEASSESGAGPGPCPFCLYDPSRPEADHRFTAMHLARHLAEWMVPSRERFLARREQVRKAWERLPPAPRRLRPDRGPGGDEGRGRETDARSGRQ